MNAMVTGASGFTGGCLARRLLEGGHRVRILVRRPDALASDLRDRADVVPGDLRDAGAVHEAVRGSEVVFHVAAVYRDALAGRRDFWEVNVGGTGNLLAACEAHGVRRLVHTSTIGVHGSISRFPSDEDAPFRPSDDYQRSKVAGEEMVWAWHRRTGIPTVVVRPAGIYGPGDLRLLKLFRTIEARRFVMLGSGKTYFHPVYIDDLVDGFLICAERENASGHSFILAGDRFLTLSDLVRAIADVLGAPHPRMRLPVWPFYLAGAFCEAVCGPLGIRPPIYRRRVGFFTHHRAFTIDKAREVLGYEPKITLEEGLRRTAEWYRYRGLLPELPEPRAPSGSPRPAIAGGGGGP
jgi:dihydroflavonol-4-reductase